LPGCKYRQYGQVTLTDNIARLLLILIDIIARLLLILIDNIARLLLILIDNIARLPKKFARLENR